MYWFNYCSLHSKWVTEEKTRKKKKKKKVKNILKYRGGIPKYKQNSGEKDKNSGKNYSGEKNKNSGKTKPK